MEIKIQDNQTQRPIVEIIIISGLLLGIMIPFLGKPFHMDDVFYIEIIKAVLQDPFRPYSFMINWYEIPGSGFGDFNPPLFSYFLAPVWAKWGAAGIHLHLVALLFVFSAVLSFYFLCREIGIKPLIPTLVFISVPFWAVGTNLMLDTPALGLALPAVLFFVAGVKRERLWPLILAGMMFSLAVLTKYSSIALFPSFFVYPFLSKKLRHAIPFAIGIAVFLIWNIYCLSIYGKPHFMNSHVVGSQVSSSFSIFNTVLFNPLVFVMIIGMTLPYAIFVIRRGAALYISLIVGFETGLFYFLMNEGMNSLVNSFLVAAGVALGLYLLIYVFRYNSDKKESFPLNVVKDHLFIFMALWILMIMIMNLIFTPIIAFRNVVFMYPALIIVMFKYAGFSAIAAKKMYIAIACMIIFQVALAYADFRYAYAHKDAAEILKSSYQDKTVWYLGHFGWQYYAQTAGFQQWSKRDDTAKGDIIVVPQNVRKQKMTDELIEKIAKIDSIKYKLSWLPIRAHSQGEYSCAGFYGSTIVCPPYIVSSQPIEIVDIYEVLK